MRLRLIPHVLRNGQVLHHVIGIAYDHGAAILCEVKSKF